MSKYPGKIVTALANTGNSVAFDGTGDFLLTTGAISFTGQLACEAWFYRTLSGGSQRTIFALNQSVNNGFGSIRVDTDSGNTALNITASIGTSGSAWAATISFNSAYVVNQWTHVLVTRDSSNVVRLFINGVLRGNATVSGTLYSALNNQLIGANYVAGPAAGNTFQGFISNVRVVNGSIPDIYQTSSTTSGTFIFSPPNQLFNITNTSLLTCNSATFTDQSNNAFAITVNGNAAVSTFTPFTAYVPYNPALGASTPGAWTLDEAMYARATRQWNMYDPYFNLTTLLLRSSSADGTQNNQFLDSSSNNFTITRNGNTTQGTFSPFSQTGWSNFFDGTDDYIAVADNAVLRPGTSNFTLEAWIWRNAAGVAHTIYAKGGASTGIVFQVTSTNVLRFTHTTTNIDSTGTIAANAWTHVAVVREGTGTNQTKLYINGTQDGQGTVSTDFTQTEEVRIGTNRGATEDYNGYISNLRFVKGTALYTKAFTPSTSPLTTTSQGATATEVELLTCQSNRFVDNSSNGFSLTITGTPSVQAFSPFYPTAAYTPQTIGGSGYFDGTGDSLSGNGVLVTTTTANTFSVEGWIYPTTFANVIWLVGDMAPTGNTNNICVEISATSGAVNLYWWTGSIQRCTSTTNLRLNQWNWFAIVVNAGAISIYVNSTTPGQSGTTTLTNRSNATQNFAIGQNNSSATPNAYIGSLRWSTSARTISSIPTAPYTSDADTRLLLNFTNAAITDATGKNNLETVGNAQASVAVRNTRLVTTPPTSMYFDGTGDYLFIPASLTNRLNGNFTIEFWVYATSIATTQQGIVAINGIASSGANGVAILLESTGKVSFWVDGNANSAQSANNVISANTWTYVALVRSGSTNTLYVNGSSVASNTQTPSWGANTAISVGRLYNDSTTIALFTGYIDDLRVTCGVARYTAAFTPPRSRLQEQ